jgi:uncharacterized protein YuzE
VAAVKVRKPRKSKAITRTKAIAGALTLARLSPNLPASQFVLDYDAEADVLYISMKHPQKATETIDLDDKGILLRYRGKELVGITVLNASRR